MRSGPLILSAPTSPGNLGATANSVSGPEEPALTGSSIKVQPPGETDQLTDVVAPIRARYPQALVQKAELRV